MAVDKKLAEELLAATTNFVVAWFKERGHPQALGNETLSMLITQAGMLIASNPCDKQRAQLFEATLRKFHQLSNVSTIVSTVDGDAVARDALRFAPVQGNA